MWKRSLAKSLKDMTKPDPRLNPWRDDLAADHLRGEVDAPRYVKGTDYQVIAPVSALRRAAAYGAMQDSQLLFGELFRVYDTQGVWSWGQSQSDDYVGYVLSEDLGVSEKPTHYLTALRSFIYTDADIKSRPLMAISCGARLTIVAHKPPFYELSNGAYIFDAHVAAIGDWQKDYVAVARQFIGMPYLWGGRESTGLDCSGLVQTILMQCGLACPRDSDMQEQVLGRSVDTAQAGDLVFWKGHVGLMSDDKNLLHANATTMNVCQEDFATACARIEKIAGPVRAIKRLS
jgi:cell wall-associated NlpC family hydrolase